MKLIVNRLDSLEPGAHHRHLLGEFKFVRRSSGDSSTFLLENGKTIFPNGAVLEFQATYTPENRALGILARLDGEQAFSGVCECEWLPCSFEIRISKDVAVGFYISIVEE